MILIQLFLISLFATVKSNPLDDEIPLDPDNTLSISDSRASTNATMQNPNPIISLKTEIPKAPTTFSNAYKLAKKYNDTNITKICGLRAIFEESQW